MLPEKTGAAGTSTPSGSGLLAVVRSGVSLLTRDEALWMVALFAAMAVVGVLEASIVALIMPLVQSIIQPELLAKTGMFGQALGRLGIEVDAQIFVWLTIAVTILLIVSTVATVFIGWWVDHEAARCRVRLCNELARKIVDAPLLWTARKNTSVITRQMLFDVRVWRVDFLQSMLELGQAVLLVAMPAAVVILLAPSRGLLAILAVGVVGILLVLATRKRILVASHNLKHNNDETIRALQHLLTGIREVKVSNRSHFFIGQFAKYQSNSNYYAIVQKLLSGLPPTMIMTLGQVGFIGTAALLWSAGLSGAEVTAQLAMLGVVVTRVMPALNKMASRFNMLVGSIPVVQGLLGMLREIDEATAEFGRKVEGKPVPPGWRQLRFRDVCFQYPGADAPNLQQLSLEFERGRRYGIVGRSGAGKSTLVNLLLGLLQPTGGVIEVDGQPLSALHLGEWHERIGYVPQDVFLVDGSLRANIAFGDDIGSVDERRMEDAVERSHLAEVVKALPQGLDTPLRERGRRLSGGQAQRVAIARALYRSPDVILLDEATSALDSVTEADIQRSFDGLGDDVVAIAIAHRVSSLRNCDSIIVLDNGRLHAIGNYDELLARDPLFRELAGQRE